MTLRTVIVFALLAAIIVPIVLAEARRLRPRAVPRTTKPAPAKPARPPEAQKPPLRLVVNRNDMDRELAALLAKDHRKSTDHLED
jgi:hypothetical protein